MKSTLAPKIVFAGLMLLAAMARAADSPTTETWTIAGKTYTTKAEAVRAIVAGGKSVEIQHTRCEIMTNRFSFKACPKAGRGTTFDNQAFEGLKVSAAK